MLCFLQAESTGEEQRLGRRTMTHLPGQDHASPVVGYPEVYPYCDPEYIHQPSRNPDNLITNPYLDLNTCQDLETKHHKFSFPEQPQTFIKPYKSHFNLNCNLTSDPQPRPQSPKEWTQRSDCCYASRPPCMFLQGTTLGTSEISTGEWMVDVEQNTQQHPRHVDGFDYNNSQTNLTDSLSDNRLPRSHFTPVGHSAAIDRPDTTDHAPLLPPLAPQGKLGGPQPQNTLFEVSTRTTIPLLGDTQPPPQSYLGLLEEHPTNLNGLSDTEKVSYTSNGAGDHIYRAAIASCIRNPTGTDPHVQCYNKGQHPQNNPVQREGCEVGTSPRQDSMMMSGLMPLSRTCEAARSRYLYQHSAGAVPSTSFPHKAPTKPTRHHPENIQAEMMNKQSGEDKSAGMVGGQPPNLGQATEGAATGHWQPGARARFEQLVTPHQPHQPRPWFRQRPRYAGDRAYQGKFHFLFSITFNPFR